MPRRLVFDRWLFLTAGLLVVGGLFMVGTASPYVAMRYGLDSHHFLLKQGLHAVLGVVAMLVVMTVPYRKYAERRIVWSAVGLCALALLVVLAMPAAGGAHRWLHLGPLRLQPSEFAKFAAILFMAWILSRKEDRVNEIQVVPLPCLTVLLPLTFLILVEPDLGTAAMLAGTACVMIFVAGLRWRYVFALAGIGALGLALGIALQPYRLQRVLAYFDPGVDPMTGGWQLSQSLVALGSGGLTGVGLGRGHQQALFLPEAHTDFIYSVVGEELGFVGCTVILGAFLLIGWRGLRAAHRAPDRFGFYLALGITTLIVSQALIHMGVCVGMLPTKGLALPFVSYGGSSLLASMVGMGVLLNVSQHGC